VAAVAVVAISATALAFGLGEYNGNVKGDPSSGLWFEVRQTEDGRRVKDIGGAGFDFTCDEGTPGDTSGVGLERSFKVEDGSFGGTSNAVILGFDPPAKITGRLKRGGRATGTIRMKGELDPEGQPGIECKTGVLEWRAEKGPPG
jgi:hypothetical protein